MIKIALAGLAVVMIAIMCKGVKSEYGIYAGIAGGIILAYMGIGRLSSIIGVLAKFEDYITDRTGYISILLKMLGIAYIAELASGISKDSGYSAVASQIEMAGKFSILLLSVPILEALLDTVLSML